MQRTQSDANAPWPLYWSFAHAISIKLVMSVAAVRVPYAMPYSNSLESFTGRTLYNC
jgi:hypothetical protein